MRARLPQVSERRVCRVLAVARSDVRRPTRPDHRRALHVNGELAPRITTLIQRHPTFGYRRSRQALEGGAVELSRNLTEPVSRQVGECGDQT